MIPIRVGQVLGLVGCGFEYFLLVVERHASGTAWRCLVLLDAGMPAAEGTIVIHHEPTLAKLFAEVGL